MTLMTIAEPKNTNRPAPGSSIKVQPIRTKKAIDHIKRLLNPRDRCLFTLGINTGYRANELLSITYRQVKDLRASDTLEVKQSKTKKHRMVTLNRTTVDSIQDFLKNDWRYRMNGIYHEDDGPLFYSQKGGVLSVPSLSTMVKNWCASVGLHGNYGSHTLRKTWGYWQYKRGKPIPLLMEAFSHRTQQQTLAYLCIQAKEIKEIYDMEL